MSNIISLLKFGGRLTVAIENSTTGERVRAIREMIKQTRKEFADELKITQSRLRVLETNHQRLNQEDFEKIGMAYPWAMQFIAYGGPLLMFLNGSPDPSQLEKHSLLFSQMAESGRVIYGKLEKNDKVLEPRANYITSSATTEEMDDFLKTVAEGLKKRGYL